MRLQALRGRPRWRRLPKGEGDRQMATVLSNILDRQFRGRATEPEVDCRLHLLSGPPKGWLYVSAVNDLFPPGGWLVNERRHDNPVSCRRAVWRRGKPNALLRHSDQGSQYIANESPSGTSRPLNRQPLR
jgi:putative transposase